ncbi:MAG: response regulator [Geothermobacteraceae bacterium]
MSPHSTRERPLILVVDDIPFFRDVMCAYFKRTPADLLTAANAVECFDLAVQKRPDLIYLDAGMPDVDGLECCRRLKKDARTCNIPVVVIFTPERDASVEDVRDCGCDGYLTKPFGKEEFLNLGHRFIFHIERRERRVPCQMTVDFTIAGQQCRGRAFDISRHGMYIEYRDELPPEHNIELQFMLPLVCADPLKAGGRIAWINQGFPRKNLKLPQGFGVEFFSIPEPTAAAIDKYLEKY